MKKMADEKSSRPSRFSRLFGRSSSRSAAPPPPYSGAEVKSKATQFQPPKFQAAEELFPDITAMSVPQWTWTNTQCREWLRKFLISHCGRSVEE